MGWQPSRFLTDRSEAERAFALAEQLGSVNAAAQELGTTWPSLRKAFTRHGLGMPARNPEAVRQRATDAARQRSGQSATPTLDPVFVALNPGALPARAKPEAEPYQWVHREEQYATLGASVVVEPYSEATPASPPPEPGRSSDGPTVATGWSANVAAALSAARPTGPTAPAGPTNPRSGRWWPMPADPPARPTGQRAAFPRLLSTLMSPGSWPEAPPGYESFERRSWQCSLLP